MTEDQLELQMSTLNDKGITTYKAIMMAAKEARFINDQMHLGIIKSSEKPTTLALKKLFEGRVVEDEEGESE